MLSLIEQIFPRVRAEIIRLLFSDPDQQLHLRDLARLSGLAVGTIQREVSNMRASGLLNEERDGNRLYFRANTENPIFPELHGIALKTTGLQVQLSQALEGLESVEYAFVYGSFAEGTSMPDSDIDLFVIGSVGLRKLSPRLRDVADQKNREVNPTVMSAESFRKKRKSKDAYIENVTAGKKLWIVGTEDEFAAMA